MTFLPSKHPARIHPASFFICFLTGIYLLDCFSPFRLSHDGIRYLLIEEWMEEGFPPNTKAAEDFLPYGYSSLLFLLAKLHLLKAFVISMVNGLYLFGSLYFVNRIFAVNMLQRHFIIYVLLNWLAIKFVITSRSEMQYLFFSCGALFFYLEFCKRKIILDFIYAFLFLTLALLTRTVAVVLLAAMVIDYLHRCRLLLVNRSRKWVLVPFILLLCVGCVYFFSASKPAAYFGYLMRPLQRHGMSVLIKGISFHFMDLGELFINSPALKMRFLNSTWRFGLYLVTGILSLTAILYALLNRKFNVPFVVRWYILFYTMVIFCWSFYDSRFWLPLLPFFIMLMLNGALQTSSFLKRWIVLYKWCYIAAGIFALSYYTYTSFNRKALSIHQDAGIWKKEYEDFFWGRPVGDSTPPARPEVVRLLRKLD